MFTTLVALFCSTLPGPQYCIEELITDTAMSGITKHECDIFGQTAIAQYMENNPRYRHDWTVQSYKCVPGTYVLKDRI